MQSASDPEVVVAHKPEDRVWAAAAHVSPLLASALPWPGMNIVGPLVIWLALRNDNPFVEHQARGAFNFQIGMALLMLANIPLTLVVVGDVLAWAIVLINVVFVLLAGIQAARGVSYHYPFSLQLVQPRVERG